MAALTLLLRPFTRGPGPQAAMDSGDAASVITEAGNQLLTGSMRHAARLLYAAAAALEADRQALLALRAQLLSCSNDAIRNSSTSTKTY